MGKPGGGTRRLARLDPADARAYARAVARLTPAIEGALAPAVVANRARGRGRSATAELEPWRHARRAWRRDLTRALLAPRPVRVFLVTDVRECFASIRTGIVAARLRALGADPHAVEEVLGWLDAFHDHGVPGLPVGPAASAILANAVLSHVDAAIGSVLPHRRWVDDVVAFAPDAGSAGRAFDAVRRSLDVLGLSPNDAKTELLTDPGGARARLLGTGCGSGADGVR